MRLRVRDLEGDRRVRDRDGPPVDGEWRGTHPPGSTYHEDNDGRLTIFDPSSTVGALLRLGNPQKSAVFDSTWSKT